MSWQKHLVLALGIIFSSIPAAASVNLVPVSGRLYVHADSVQGSDDFLYTASNDAETLWPFGIQTNLKAQADPIAPDVDGFLLAGNSSFASAGVKYKSITNTSYGFQFSVNNQATQAPENIENNGPYGWGYSVSYMRMRFDTIGYNGSQIGDPMKVSIKLNLEQELLAMMNHDPSTYDMYQLELGFALGCGIPDYNPVSNDPANESNPGLAYFDKYYEWNSKGYSYEHINFSDSLEYNGHIGDQVDMLVSLSSFSYSYWGYSWTNGGLVENPLTTSLPNLQTVPLLTSYPAMNQLYPSMDLLIGSQAVVPEPATMLRLGSGLIGLVGLGKKNKK